VAIPGDEAILLHEEGHRLSVGQDGKSESDLSITDKQVGEIILPHSRFVGKSIIGVSDSPKSLAVATTKGEIFYDVAIIPSLSRDGRSLATMRHGALEVYDLN